jgi:tetratricopeptide (TPR) repeat protein
VTPEGEWPAESVVRKLAFIAGILCLLLLPAAAQAQSFKLTGMVHDAYALHAQQRYEEALPVAREAYVLAGRELGPNHPFAARCGHLLGDIILALKNYARAEAHYLHALEVALKAYGGPNDLAALSLSKLAEVSVAKGDFATATQYTRQIFDYYETHYGSDDRRLVELRRRLDWLLVRQDLGAEAAEKRAAEPPQAEQPAAPQTEQPAAQQTERPGAQRHPRARTSPPPRGMGPSHQEKPLLYWRNAEGAGQPTEWWKPDRTAYVPPFPVNAFIIFFAALFLLAAALLTSAARTRSAATPNAKLRDLS